MLDGPRSGTTKAMRQSTSETWFSVDGHVRTFTQFEYLKALGAANPLHEGNYASVSISKNRTPKGHQNHTDRREQETEKSRCGRSAAAVDARVDVARIVSERPGFDHQRIEPVASQRSEVQRRFCAQRAPFYIRSAQGQHLRMGLRANTIFTNTSPLEETKNLPNVSISVLLYNSM